MTGASAGSSPPIRQPFDAKCLLPLACHACLWLLKQKTDSFVLSLGPSVQVKRDKKTRLYVWFHPHTTYISSRDPGQKHFILGIQGQSHKI